MWHLVTVSLQDIQLSLDELMAFIDLEMRARPQPSPLLALIRPPSLLQSPPFYIMPRHPHLDVCHNCIPDPESPVVESVLFPPVHILCTNTVLFSAR